MTTRVQIVLNPRAATATSKIESLFDELDNTLVVGIGAFLAYEKMGEVTVELSRPLKMSAHSKDVIIYVVLNEIAGETVLNNLTALVTRILTRFATKHTMLAFSLTVHTKSEGLEERVR